MPCRRIKPPFGKQAVVFRETQRLGVPQQFNTQIHLRAKRMKHFQDLDAVHHGIPASGQLGKVRFAQTCVHIEPHALGVQKHQLQVIGTLPAQQRNDKTI